MSDKWYDIIKSKVIGDINLQMNEDTEAILHNQESLVALDYVKWKGY